MQLLLTCHRDPFSHIGGSETVIREMSTLLAQRGHRVTVLTRREPEVSQHGMYDAFTGEAVPFYAGQRNIVSVLTLDPNGRGPFKTNRALANFVGFSYWDAILLYGQNTWLTDEVWREVGYWHLYSGSRVVYAPVGFLNLERPNKAVARFCWSLYYHVVQKHIIEESDATVALTEHEVDIIQHIARPKSLVKIPNGVVCARFKDGWDDSVLDRYHIERPFILNVAGDYENKCLPDACLGVRALNRTRGQKYQLVLVGPGTVKYSTPWVRGLGLVSEDDKVALYREAAAVLQTSDFEGFGVTLLEALASGTPFVSTRVGAAQELASQFGGTLINVRTPASIAYHLAQELDTERDPDALRAVAARYDWSVVLPRFEAVMHEA